MLFVPFVTVISPVTKLLAWFCWFTVIVAVEGVGVVSEESSKEKFCIFELTVKVDASLTFVNVCFFITVCIFSRLMLYVILALSAVIPLWSANTTGSPLDVPFVEEGVIPLPEAVTLNCPAVGVPLVIPFNSLEPL